MSESEPTRGDEVERILRYYMEDDPADSYLCLDRVLLPVLVGKLNELIGADGV